VEDRGDAEDHRGRNIHLWTVRSLRGQHLPPNKIVAVTAAVRTKSARKIGVAGAMPVELSRCG